MGFVFVGHIWKRIWGAQALSLCGGFFAFHNQIQSKNLNTLKNFYTKINTIWVRFNTWGKESIVGDFLVSFLRTSFFITTASLIFFGLFIISPFSESFLEETRSCNVQGIKLHGYISEYATSYPEGEKPDITTSDDFTGAISKANEDDDIKAILIEVSSHGGLSASGDEMSIAVKNSKKPVVAFIRGQGASSAYLAISGADRIFASKSSDVGGIGITMSYKSNVGKNKKEGYEFEQLSAGKYKDYGSDDKLLTQEERKLIMRDINIIYEDFIETVSANRAISLEKVRSFADGATVMGEMAKERGLIDEIGGVNEAKAYLKKKIGDSVEVCWK